MNKKNIFVITILLIIYSLVFIFVRYKTSSIGNHTQDATSIVIDHVFVDKTFNLINNERIKVGIKPLIRNFQLDKSAELKLQDIINNNYWSHVSPNDVPPWIFFEKAGYKYRYAGENLARGFTTPENTVYAWMMSIGHKANILDTNFIEMGIAGTMYNEEIIVVQHFGTKDNN